MNLNTVATAYRELQSEGLLAIRHGSGAVVAAPTQGHKPEEEMRTPLRTALTQLVLSGLPRTQIMNIVAEELRGLMKRSTR